MTTSKPAYFGKDLEAMSFAHNYHQWIVDEFTTVLGRNVAEVGAGVGNFSDFLLSSGVQHLTAFEPSSNMYPHLAQRFADATNVSTHNEFFEEVSDRFADSFDTVVYINVLEHIEDDDKALAHAFTTIRPGGHLVVFVPALEWLYSELDRQVGHFRRYRRDQLIKAITGAGFEVEKAKYFDIMGIVPWYVAFVKLKHSATSTNVSLYDKWVVPLMSRIERFVTPPIGKNLLVIAKRP